MSNPLANINDFSSLIIYLREELYWPISEEDFEEIFFDYTPKELGIEKNFAVKINSIKQLRPLSEEQPYKLYNPNINKNVYPCPDCDYSKSMYIHKYGIWLPSSLTLDKADIITICDHIKDVIKR